MTRDLNVNMRGLYLLAAPSTPAEVIDAVAERSADGDRVSLGLRVEAGLRLRRDILSRNIPSALPASLRQLPALLRSVNFIGHDLLR